MVDPPEEIPDKLTELAPVLSGIQTAVTAGAGRIGQAGGRHVLRARFADTRRNTGQPDAAWKAIKVCRETAIGRRARSMTKWRALHPEIVTGPACAGAAARADPCLGASFPRRLAPSTGAAPASLRAETDVNAFGIGAWDPKRYPRNRPANKGAL